MELGIVILDLSISGTQNVLSQSPGPRDVCHSQGTCPNLSAAASPEEPSMCFTLFFSHHITEMTESLDYLIYIFYYGFLKRNGGTSL